MTDPALEALWKRVVDDWDNDAAHGAFLEHCQTTDQLLEAAVRYRGMAGDRVRGPSAQKRLGAVATLSIARLETMRTPEPRVRADVGRLLLIVFFVAGTIALVLVGLR